MTDRSPSWPHAAADLLLVESLPPSIGIIGLATDRVGIPDFQDFLPADVPVFSTRVPMAERATPQSLAAMGDHLADAAANLVPGSRLDVVAFSCTSGSIAIGPDRVVQAIRSARTEIPVAMPMSAGAAGLKRLGSRRIALLTPYLPQTADLVADYFAAAGFDVAARATFGLDGDPQMNRVTPENLISASRDLVAVAPDCDALFISCTGLRTRHVVARLEEEIGRPVVTSNGALAWECLRAIGNSAALEDRGRLFAI